MPDLDYYQILGVASDASRRAIRIAYREALRRYHPDTNRGKRCGEQMLHQVIIAGRILCDPQQRARYDRQRQTRRAQVAAPPTAAAILPRTSFQRLLRCGRALLGRFFCAASAAATERRAAQQRQRKPRGFDFYLNHACRDRTTVIYRLDPDGIYRKAKTTSHRTKGPSWCRRSAIWLLGGIFAAGFWRGG